jgi:triosephosphate isomerase
MKTCHVLANWKMHKTGAQAVDFMDSLKEALKEVSISQHQSVALAVPFTMIAACHKAAQKRFSIGAQNMHDAQEGAFTGEISASMLVDAHAEFVILGHSERRHLFNENEAFIAAKLKRALTATKLQIIFCVGETLKEKVAGQTLQVLDRQLEALKGLTAKDHARVMVAYEPVWAVGTGKVASAEDIHKSHEEIFEKLKSFGFDPEEIKILYGGSVKAQNVASIVSLDKVSGVLVGGASLEVEKFADLIKAAFTA